MFARAQKILSRLGRVFTIGEMQQAYQMCLRSPQGALYLLPDLSEFCGANDPAPWNGDPFVQGRAAGRRDVWLHVQQYLNLTAEELATIYSGKSILRKEDFAHNGMV